jgi:pSer/pThr/pTyr-binding forkhead associated (FHA) protein
MASLTITESPGGQAGTRFIVRQRPLAGGRHPSQEIQLLDAEVSRRHFLIRIEGDDHVITELQAANGLYVNGQKVKEHALQDGDQIRVGTTVLVYSKQDDDDHIDAVQEQRRADRRIREAGTVLKDFVIPPDKSPPS